MQQNLVFGVTSLEADGQLLFTITRQCTLIKVSGGWKPNHIPDNTNTNDKIQTLIQLQTQVQRQMQIRSNKEYSFNRLLQPGKDGCQIILQPYWRRLMQMVAKKPLEFLIKFIVFFTLRNSGQAPGIQFSNGSLTYLGR